MEPNYTNEKGEVVIISEMDDSRLIHAIAKYAEQLGKGAGLVKDLKVEAMKRLANRVAPVETDSAPF